MADDPSKTGKEDDIRISVNQDHEVQYWTKKLGCTAEELKACAARVGPMVKDIKKCLGK
jgi:hypothetical protein